MINQNDLRIGNKFTIEFPQFYPDGITVESINEEGINLYPVNGYIEHKHSFDELHGIPLTPELLEKCGFVKTVLPSGSICHTLKFNDAQFCDLSLLGREEKGVYVVILFPYMDHFKYQYLHEIQNAFYSITKNELKINL